MSAWLLIIVLLMVPSAWADAPVGQLAKVPVDVGPILTNIKNPFQSQVPPPPVVVIEKSQEAGNQGGDQSNSNGFNNPVKPPEPEKPKVSVEGMVWSDTIHQAIINGQVVGVGDEVNGVKVLQVHRDGVNVSYKGHEFTYTVE